jgi:hypothetical protein
MGNRRCRRMIWKIEHSGVSGLDTTKSTCASKIGPTASPLDCIPTSGADHFFELPGEVKRPILAAQGWGYPQEFA